MVNVCPEHFFATRYGLAAIMQKELSFGRFLAKINKVPSPGHCIGLERFGHQRTRPGLPPSVPGLGMPLAVDHRFRCRLLPSISGLGRLLAVRPGLDRGFYVSSLWQASDRPSPVSLGLTPSSQASTWRCLFSSPPELHSVRIWPACYSSVSGPIFVKYLHNV